MSTNNFSKNHEKSKELCFNQNEFLKESFSVDTFLREHINTVSLEIMRDDLGTHLKTLRLAMIELINKDYEDFVNLSKDLVGLDDGIKKIQVPLINIRDEVMGIKNDLEETITGFNNCLEQHKEIIEKKKSLIHVAQVITCINKLQSIIATNEISNSDSNLDLIERATVEFNQLHFSVSKSGQDLNDIYKREAEDIQNKLMCILNQKFLECLKMKMSDQVVKCLKIYTGLGKTEELELLVRKEVVAPKLEKLISEQALQKEPNGISQIYIEIINFIERELIDLFRMTTYKEKPPVVKGFNFIVNSLWPELEKKLDLPLMFAPGNPKVFHLRFLKSVELVQKLEEYCGNHMDILKFRQDPLYVHFFQRWNLPVYFKIRFQEIAGLLEKNLSETDASSLMIENKSSYYLKSSVTLIQQLQKCWDEEVFLPQLSHLFWKLSLQILSRYSIWIMNVLSRESEFLEKRKRELGRLQSSYGMNNFQVRSRLDFTVCLFCDTEKLLLESETFLEKSKEKIPNNQLIVSELNNSLKEALQAIDEILPRVKEHIVKVLVDESAVHFHQVNQIPRLFRRTNRKSTTEPCEYVGQVLDFPRQFYSLKKSFLEEDVLESLLTSTFIELTKQYYSVVNEVLTNAQKTEESLRKLKKKKDAYSNKNSGDEEIRQQLVIDVKHFGQEFQKMGISKDKVDMMDSLIELVESARNKSEYQTY